MEGSQILIQILNGISYGLLLFLLAAGLSLMFGLLGIVNMAHGSSYILGAYLGLSLLRTTGSFLLAILGAALIMGVIGAFMELFFIRKLYKQELDQVLLTFGFAYIFMDVSRWVWGGTPRALPKPSLLDGSVNILGEAYPSYRLAMIAVGLVTAFLLWLFLEKTRTGLIIRAGVDDKEMVGGLGINIKPYFTAVFSLGAFLAAFGGVIGGPVIGVYPGLDAEILVLALAVVVVGGLGTLRGAFFGSMAVGLIDTFGKVLFPNYALVTIYIAMALILIFKPSGLMGKEQSR